MPTSFSKPFSKMLNIKITLLLIIKDVNKRFQYMIGSHSAKHAKTLIRVTFLNFALRRKVVSKERSVFKQKWHSEKCRVVNW